MYSQEVLAISNFPKRARVKCKEEWNKMLSNRLSNFMYFSPNHKLLNRSRIYACFVHSIAQSIKFFIFFSTKNVFCRQSSTA